MAARHGDGYRLGTGRFAGTAWWS